MEMHWVVVADAASAKIYASNALLHELTLVDDIRVSHDRVLHLDADGASNHPLPGSGPGSVQAEHDPHKLTEERFARAVAQTLNEGEGHHRFERLILVAPPRYLGDLSAALSHAAGKRVVARIHHDWTRLSGRELAEHLRKNMPADAGMP